MSLPHNKEIDDLFKFGQKLVDTGKAEMCLTILPASDLFWQHPKLIDAAGLAAEKLGQYELAKDYYYKAIKLFPSYPPPYVYAMRINEILWEYQESERVLYVGLGYAPNDPFLLAAEGEYLLRNREYEKGWKSWEYRMVRRNLCEKNKDLPVWNGDDLNGRTLLVAGEQGIGDHIMFARYLKPLSEKGNVVVYLQIPTKMDALLQSISTIPVYSKPEQLATVDKVDCWATIGSLPLLLNDYIPTPMVYIEADPIKEARYSSYFNDKNFRVGLCWRGNSRNSRDAQRSIPFKILKPLLDVPGVAFYSLQKDDHESGLQNITGNDFDSTAAMIANLDLVITVDTAVGHVAGAMGKPVWIMIGLNSDWRWGVRDTLKSTWYTSDILFWQNERGNWNELIGRVKAKLYETVDVAQSTISAISTNRNWRHIL
jgi:tetratricopeptide (TPR) repeat protein